MRTLFVSIVIYVFSRFYHFCFHTRWLIKLRTTYNEVQMCLSFKIRRYIGSFFFPFNIFLFFFKLIIQCTCQVNMRTLEIFPKAEIFKTKTIIYRPIVRADCWLQKKNTPPTQKHAHPLKYMLTLKLDICELVRAEKISKLHIN